VQSSEHFPSCRALTYLRAGDKEVVCSHALKASFNLCKHDKATEERPFAAVCQHTAYKAAIQHVRRIEEVSGVNM